MNNIKAFLIVIYILISFASCTSQDDKVKEYREINEKIEKIQKEIINGTKNQEDGVKQMAELQLKLNSFDSEVSDRYSKEKVINEKIEIERAKLNKQKRLDSIEQANLNKKIAIESKNLEDEKAREEELELMREAAEMVRLEDEADMNLYLYELQEMGMFLVEFDGKYYEINQKEWNDWKISEKYDAEEGIKETQAIVKAMGSNKANELAKSMYRTLSNGISREGISMKALQGIQIYDVITTGKTKFH